MSPSTSSLLSKYTTNLRYSKNLEVIDDFAYFVSIDNSLVRLDLTQLRQKGGNLGPDYTLYDVRIPVSITNVHC